jgi:hypothetical protein
LSVRTRSITGSARRVAVCIGRKKATKSAPAIAASGSRSRDRSTHSVSTPAACSAAAADASPNG